MSTFKKTKVVLLPTKEKAVNAYFPFSLSLRHHDNVLMLRLSNPDNPYCQNQNLYFLSDEEIKEGDWYIHNQKGVGLRVQKCIGTNLPMDAKKIIATTDSNLTIKTLLFVQGENKEIDVLLPQPSQSFIEKFVEEYNKGNVITEVLVEYYYSTFGSNKEELTNNEKLVPKINPKDNTITIRKVKDSWNREEVIELLHKRMEYTFGEDYDKSTTDKWIEENL